ncbi:hypothetical protein [Propionivibrio sp.]|uniref:hypothetical protein n=1 Tax=Propionivibrio sp. TaxID=2212460 RepID=UPI003BF2E7F7
MSSPAEKFLARADVYRYKAGATHGVFKCPAHADKRASATWRELDDGRLLIHCFAGCDAPSILAAIGLEMTDLYPERLTDSGKRERRPFLATDALRCVAFEALVVAAAAAALATGEPLSSVDRDRLMVAAERLTGAARSAGL